MKNYVIGLDSGSDSVQTILDADTGKEYRLGPNFPRGKEQKSCDLATNLFPKHPFDILKGWKIPSGEWLLSAVYQATRSEEPASNLTNYENTKT